MEVKCIADDQERQTDPGPDACTRKDAGVIYLVLTVMKYDNFSFAQQR